MRVWSEGPLPWELLEAVTKANASMERHVEVSEDLKTSTDEVGYARPTPIQMQAQEVVVCGTFPVPSC